MLLQVKGLRQLLLNVELVLKTEGCYKRTLIPTLWFFVLPCDFPAVHTPAIDASCHEVMEPGRSSPELVLCCLNLPLPKL